MFKLPNYFHQVRTIENINNNQLKSKGAMPHKDEPSDGTSHFASNRHEYLRTAPVQPSQTNVAIANKKMWYGNSSNRMSSKIVENKKTRAIGKNTLNLNPSLMSFTNHTDKNMINRSIIRVRRCGGAAPPKIGAKK